MSLRIDPDVLLATARTLRLHARWVSSSPIPVGHDPRLARARAAAQAVAADLHQIAERLVALVRDVAGREEAVAEECARLRRRWRA
ncbi:hypothetical protein [Nocardioides coralli]|uniref:hypothetical protein n=1 Tax=Nocardioides coralli TaxID=2872154 RepID=UPI001CA4171D|nr:hypothetical protein [Nocardioides coralli]QZY28900.1 hypothetical protein K6T13_15860 [Nocardioides coralli]